MKEAKLIQYLFQISSELPTSEETVQGLQDCRTQSMLSVRRTNRSIKLPQTTTDKIKYTT